MNRFNGARTGLALALGGLLLILAAGADSADARSRSFWKLRVLNGGKADVISALAEIPVPGTDFRTIRVGSVRSGCQRSAYSCGCLVADHVRLLLCVAPAEAPRSLQLVYPDDGDEGGPAGSIRWVNVIVGSGLDGEVSAQAIIHFWSGHFVVRPLRAVGGSPCGPELPPVAEAEVVDPGASTGSGSIFQPLEPHPFVRIRLKNTLPEPMAKVEVRGHRSPTAPGDTHVTPPPTPLPNSSVYITSSPDQPNFANEVEICVLVDLNRDGDTEDDHERYFLSHVLDNSDCRIKRVDVIAGGTVAAPIMEAEIILWPKSVGEPPCAPPEANGVIRVALPEVASGEACAFKPPPGPPPPLNDPGGG